MTTDLANIPADFRVLASGIKGPEGPAIGPDGQLYLVSTEDAAIIRVSSDGEITQIAKTDGRPNGLVFNSAGEMFVADAGLKAILRISSEGKVETFVDDYEGAALGGPNDLCFLPNGDLLFTDPIRRPLPDPAISPIYRATPAGIVSVFANELAYPNGIAVSVDRKSVYVSESRSTAKASTYRRVVHNAWYLSPSTMKGACSTSCWCAGSANRAIPMAWLSMLMATSSSPCRSFGRSRT